MRVRQSGFVTLEVIALAAVAAFLVGLGLGAGGTFWLMRGDLADAKAKLEVAQDSAKSCGDAVEKQNDKVDGLKAEAEKAREESRKQLDGALKEARGYYARAAELAGKRAKATDPAGICREAEAMVDDYLASRRGGK